MWTPNPAWSGRTARRVAALLLVLTAALFAVGVAVAAFAAGRRTM